MSEKCERQALRIQKLQQKNNELLEVAADGGKIIQMYMAINNGAAHDNLKEELKL